MLRSIATAGRRTPALIRARLAILLVGFSILVLLFWGLGALAEHGFPPENSGVDGSLTRSASEVIANNRTLRGVLRVVTELGGGAVTIPLAVGVGLIWWWKRRRWDFAWLLALSIGGSSAAKALVKGLVSRPRPPVARRLIEATGSSFPSGHAVRGVALFGALVVLAVAMDWSRRAKVIVWLAASALVVVIASSRVLLGVHYLTDVTAGVALGIVWLALVVASDRRAASTLGLESVRIES